MASPHVPPGPPAWSVSVVLRHRCGLEIRAAAKNVLLGWWGRGGERLSLLLRLRRCFRLSVTSQCGNRPTQPETPPRGCGIVRFLRGRCAALPRVTSIWRRKKQKQPPARVAAAVPRGRLDQRSPTPARPGILAMARTPESVATLRFVVAALAVAVASVAVFRLTMRIECWDWRGCRKTEPLSRWARFLELMEHPPLHGKYKWLLGLPKRGLEWLFSK